LLVGGITVSVLGLPLPAVGSQPEPAQFIISSLIAGTLVGLTLGPLGSRLNLSLHERACLWFLLLFVLNGLMNVVEAVFFTTNPVTQLASSLAILAFGQAVLAILLTLLFRPQQTGPGLITRLRETLAQKSGRGHPLSGTKETWVAPFAPRLTLHALSTTSVNRQGPPSMPRAELSINGLKSWGRDWLRLVEKTGVPAASNALKTPGAVEFTTKTEPTPMIFWFWTRPAINATPWCSRWWLGWASRCCSCLRTLTT